MKFPSLVPCLALLCGCSPNAEHFDSEPGKGVGARPISRVNTMVDRGEIPDVRGDGVPSPRIAPVFVPGGIPQHELDSVIVSDKARVTRTPERHVRVWVAPYQDGAGNFHEGTYVHTLIRPSTWAMQNVTGERV
jgi:hypothetical protein